jgi:hypothetical protein
VRRRGQVAALLPSLLLAFLALGALVVDLGLAFVARTAAQGAADAGALAGALAFTFPGGDSVHLAEAWARETAGQNTILGGAITAGDVTVQVETLARIVRVGIRGEAATAFARILGVTSLDVQASAAATGNDTIRGSRLIE